MLNCIEMEKIKKAFCLFTYLILALGLVHCHSSSSEELEESQADIFFEEDTAASNGEKSLENLEIYTFERIKAMSPEEATFHKAYTTNGVFFEDLTSWKLEEMRIDQVSFLFYLIEWNSKQDMSGGVTLQSFTPEQFKRLFDTLDDKKIRKLNIFIDHFSLEQLEALTPEQIDMISVALVPEQFAGLSAEDLFYDGLLYTMECDEIKYIRPDVVKGILQVKNYFSSQHSDVHCLTKEQITALTPQEAAWIVQDFTKEQLSWITPEYIKAIPTFKKYGYRAFSRINDAWINYLSEEQLLALSPEQKKIIGNFEDTETKRLAHFIEHNNYAKRLYELRIQGRDLFKNGKITVSQLREERSYLYMLDLEQYESMSFAQVSSIRAWKLRHFSSRRIKHIPHLIKYLRPGLLKVEENLNERVVSSIAPEQFVDLTKEQLEAILSRSGYYYGDDSMVGWLTAEQFLYIPDEVFGLYYEELCSLIRSDKMIFFNEEKVDYCFKEISTWEKGIFLDEERAKKREVIRERKKQFEKQAVRG